MGQSERMENIRVKGFGESYLNPQFDSLMVHLFHVINVIKFSKILKLLFLKVVNMNEWIYILKNDY